MGAVKPGLKVAVLQCVGRIATTGQRCPNPARPGTRRCGFHKSIPPEARRCKHVWADGARCENYRKLLKHDKGSETCQSHMTECVTDGCARRISKISGLCKVCQGVVDRAGAAATKKTPMTREERWNKIRNEHPRCAVRHTAETGQPCEGYALKKDSPFCSKHRNLPTDEERCTHTWEDGDRCPARWVVHTDRRCTHHRTGLGKGSHRRGKYKGEQPIHRPCPVCGTKSKGILGCAEHAPRCQGTTAKGNPCPRTGTVLVDGLTYCGSHSTVHVTPEYRPLKGGRRFFCGAESGVDGDPCDIPVSKPGNRCYHHKEDLPDEVRCIHIYTSGTRCPGKRIGRPGRVHCTNHYVPGSRETVQCTMTKAIDGERCTKDADPRTGICGIHARVLEAMENSDLPRCSHLHLNGDRCTEILPLNGTNMYRDLCQYHVIPCRESNCTRHTSMSDGLCKRHRPKCGHKLENGRKCKAPVYGNASACWRHGTEDERCALLTRNGEPCRLPARHDTSEGRICAAHVRDLPPDEIRCVHVHPEGQRCAHRTDRGTYWCSKHRNGQAVPCESLSAYTNEPCDKFVVPRPGQPNLCETHGRNLPDEQRCIHRYIDGSRCPNLRHQDLDTCANHSQSVKCGVTTPLGEPCERRIIPRAGKSTFCHDHEELPKPYARCVHVFDNGDQCPAERISTNLHCDYHQAFRPWCIATDSEGVKCGRRAEGGRDTCDDHIHWTPGQPLSKEDPEALWRFFVKPNASYIWETVQAYAAEASALANPTRKSDPDASVDMTKVGQLEAGDVVDLERLRQVDPFDLTGAQRYYLENLEFGFSDEELALAAERMLQRYAPNTLRALTGKLRGYLQFCKERHLVAVPAERSTITRYLSFLTIKAVDDRGQPLQASSIDQLRDALRQAHEVAGYDNPWTKWPILAHELRGYRRLYSRPVIQAHAIRLPELASLIGAAHATAGLSPRDAAILTVVADPEVGISLRNAAALTWEQVTLQEADSPQPMILTVGRKQYLVPHRAIEPLASDAAVPANELPISVRLCGVTALRSLAAQLISEGQTLSGPVFRKEDSTEMTHAGVAKVIKEAAFQARLPKATTYTTDERLRLLDAASRPDPIGIRDAAIMNLMWWGSLRRSEVGPLTIGDLAKDSQGRGVILLIRKSKTDVNGEYVPLPWVHGPDGRPLPTDTWQALTEWFERYETLIGRSLSPEDPLFINIHRDRGTSMSADGIGDVVTRYAAPAGVQAELGERISSHGFRAGYATEALAQGMSSEAVAKTQRRSGTPSLMGYNRPTNPYESLLTQTLDTSDEVWERYERAKLTL
jgi:site-specific recombinase XerD